MPYKIMWQALPVKRLVISGYKLLLVLLAILSSGICTAQTGNFQKIFGGLDDESAFSVRQTWDGGFILCGNSQSHGIINGKDNILLIKTNSTGVLEWARVYGDSSAENASCVRQAPDSSYWITGRTFSHGSGDADVFLLHTGQQGNPLLFKTFGDSLYEAGQALEITSEGGCIITGGTYSAGNGDQDAFILKSDSTGQLEWLRIFGTNQFEHGTSIILLPSNGYLSVGRGTETGSMDILLSRFDQSGNLDWSKTYSGPGYDESYAVCLPKAGGFLVAGSTLSYGNNLSDILLLKTDTNGNILAARTFGGLQPDAAYSVYSNSDSGFVVAGYSESFSGLLNNPSGRGSDSANVFVLRTDASLDTVWSVIYGNGLLDESFSVIQKSDNGFAVAAFGKSFGNDSSRAYLLCMDTAGQSGCHQLYVQPFWQDVLPVTLTNFFNVINSGFDTASYNINSYIIALSDTFLCSPFFSSIQTHQDNPPTISPNPFSRFVNVALANMYDPTEFQMEIYNLYANPVYTTKLQSGTNVMDLSSLNNGIYFYRIRNTSGKYFSGKLIKAN